MVEIKPLPKIVPLWEDLIKIIKSSFLQSTHFKRWLVEVEFDDVWNNCLKIAENNYRGLRIIGNSDEVYSLDTLVLLLNNFYEKKDYKNLVFLVKGILKTYSACNSQAIDVDIIQKDLSVAGIGETLIQTFDELKSVGSHEYLETDDNVVEYTESRVRSLEKIYKEASSKEINSMDAIRTYHEWHSSAVVYLSNYYSNANADYVKFKNIDNSGNGYTLLNNYHELYSIYNLLMIQTNKESNARMERSNSPMVFISHSSKDKVFVEELVELLESIGFDESNLFCSSVDGYDIGLGEDIFETLKKLFREHELFVIFVHSPRYYESPVSLNEMGAAWVLKTNFYSFLTQDMQFERMKGVVNSDKVAIKVSAEDAKARLNELKDKLCAAFNLESISHTKWERKRDRFLENVNHIKQ